MKRVGRWALKFNEEHLRFLIQRMTPRSRVFKVLRQELTKLGRWKNKPRGKPGFKKGNNEWQQP